MDSLNDNSPIDIELVSPLVVYPFDPASKLSNTLKLVLSNTQRLADIPWRDGAAIAIVLYTTDNGDPSAIATVEAAKQIGQGDLRVEGCKRAWTPSFVQGSNSLTILLRPEESDEPLLGHGEHAQLSVAIANLRSDLPVTVEPIPLLAMATGFFDDASKNASASFSLARNPCPPPSGNFSPPKHPVFGQPLLGNWDIQFADEMIVKFSDGASPDTVLKLSQGDFSTQESDFVLRKEVLLPGSLTVFASNLSNSGADSPPPWPTGVYGTAFCDIEATIEWPADGPGACHWSFSPPGVVENTTISTTTHTDPGRPPTYPGQRFGYKFHADVKATATFWKGILPDVLIDAQFTISQSMQDMPYDVEFSVAWPGVSPIVLEFPNWRPMPEIDAARSGDGPNGPWSMSFKSRDDLMFSALLKFSVHANLRPPPQAVAESAT